MMTGTQNENLNMITDSSIDQVELRKFNKTYFEWWNELGEFKILHQITPLRIEYIVQTAMQHFTLEARNTPQLAGLNVLDVGCGGGLASVPLYKCGAKVTAIDANPYNIAASQEHAAKHELTINYQHQTAEEHLKSNQQYDIVVCLEVVEHVANLTSFMQTLTKLVAPGGMLIISTINRTLKSFALAIIMAEYVLGLIPKGTHDYLKFVKPSELQPMLEITDYGIRQLCGLKLDPIANQWQLTNDINVNYFAYIAKNFLK